MLGGDRAAKEPWRSFYAHLSAFAPDISEAELAALLPGKSIHQLNNALKKRVNCHTIRSAGRLFDAVAFSLGIVSSKTPLDYEGQAACLLEALARQCPSTPEPPFQIPLDGLTLDLQTFWQQWLKQCVTSRNLSEKAYQFHAILAQSLANIVTKANAQHSLDHLVLTGGVFHNALLRMLIKQALPPHIRVLEHHLYSCGDGGLALGQLAVAACKANRQDESC
jgi:hydrogenase maturation protein HypF